MANNQSVNKDDSGDPAVQNLGTTLQQLFQQVECGSQQLQDSFQLSIEPVIQGLEAYAEAMAPYHQGIH